MWLCQCVEYAPLSDCVRGCVLTNVHMPVWVPAYIECRKGYNKSSGARGLIYQQWSSLLSPLRLAPFPTETGVHRCITKPTEGKSASTISVFLMGKQPQWNMTASDKVVMYISEGVAELNGLEEGGCFLCSIRNQFSILCLICCCWQTPEKPWNPI